MLPTVDLLLLLLLEVCSATALEASKASLSALNLKGGTMSGLRTCQLWVATIEHTSTVTNLSKLFSLLISMLVSLYPGRYPEEPGVAVPAVIVHSLIKINGYSETWKGRKEQTCFGLFRCNPGDGYTPSPPSTFPALFA